MLPAALAAASAGPTAIPHSNALVLLAAFTLVLARYTGQDYGGVRSCSGSSALDEVLGCLGELAPLRIDCSGGLTLCGLVGQVRQALQEAWDRRELPLAQDASARPAGQTEATAPAILVAQLRHQGEQLQLTVTHDTDRFDSATVAVLLEQLMTVLTQAAEHPQQPASQISLLTAQGRAQLPDPTAPIPAQWDGPIHAWFAQQAQRVPENCAVSDRDGCWTYAELHARSDQLAQHLRACGIQPQEVVAIYGHRSAPLVWALLGVLKAGAAFMILDPAHPAARLSEYCRIAQPHALIQIAAAGALPDDLATALAGLPLCCRVMLPNSAVDPGCDWRDDDPYHSCTAELAPDARMYITFTSGSTGRPKAIVGTHRPLTHFVGWHCSTFGLEQADRFSLLSGLAHDPALRDIFTPLSLGATLCIPDPAELGLPGRLAAWMAQQQITVAHLTPALGQLLTTRGTALPALRYAFFGGDVLRYRDVATLRAHAPAATCVNFYGATETPQAVGYAIVATDASRPAGRGVNVPIGQGIAGVQLLVLNTAGQLAGVGEVGEICVRTPYLSSGYLGDDTLSRERFVANPFTSARGDWLYRTGDLGRYRPDGAVEFLGRADQQVKIRGFRVEPREIEGLLAQHPAVRATVVVAREDRLDDRQLVAYVVLADTLGGAKDDCAMLLGELRATLAERLPDYMLPAAFVVLDQLPLTPNGKLDRQALPPPDLAAVAPSAPVAAPRNPTEAVIAAIWCDVLGLECVGIHDDFFALGGHSLKAMQVLSRILDAFQAEIALPVFFAQPTIAGLAEAVMRARDDHTAQGAPRIVPLGRARAFGEPLVRPAAELTAPASFAQERLWFLDQLNPGSPAYTMTLAVRLTGALDLAALEQSIAELVQRHQVLRTTFRSVEGRPVQIITQRAAKLRLIALDNLVPAVPAKRWAAAIRLAEDEAERSFNLSAGPLMRVSLLCLGQQDYLLLVSIHHIVFDGWSTDVLLGELAALYTSHVTGQPAALMELPIQYADYAAWQRRWLQGRALERQLAYWRQRLAGIPAALDLPTDHSQAAQPDFGGGTAAFSLPAPLVQQLKAVSRAAGATLCMTLFAAFTVLLGRYARQTDLVVGTPIAGRTRTELEGLIGLFVNTLVLRTDLSGNPQFCELMRQVRSTALAAYAHQDVPFERLVAELQPTRDPHATPLFQVVFAFQNTPMQRKELPGVALAPIQLRRRTAKFLLTLELWESADGIAGQFEYCTARFEAATIQRMVGHYQCLLAAVADDPTRRIGDLPMLTERERQQLAAWNATAISYPREQTIPQLFAAQVASTPDAVALVCGGQQLTYAALDAHANRLAHYLRRRGVGPEVPVALCLERSLASIVALLGILKAGGAYVSLDPTYPSERLAFMLEDTQAPVIITQSDLAAGLVAHGAALICVDTDADVIAAEQPDPPPDGGAPDQIAYISYTSGSTGRPKGVSVPHRGVLRLVVTPNYVHLGPDEIVLQFAPLAFDASTLEVWGALLNGARLVVAPPGALSLAEIGQLLHTCQVTTAWLTAGMFHQMVDFELEGLRPLRQLLAGGDVLSAAHVRKVLETLPGCTVINGYGPTENTTFTSCHPLHGPDEVGATVAIGRPINNSQVYVLDDRMEPVPIGVIGELYTGGDGLARGYLGRPDLTAERFVPNPFATPTGTPDFQHEAHEAHEEHEGDEGYEEPGHAPAQRPAALDNQPATQHHAAHSTSLQPHASSLWQSLRLYRTGDLVRQRPDGTIEFLGRLDAQIKLRGFRVELSEIEAVLGQHPLVREAAVLATDDQQGEKRLVAYIVCHKQDQEQSELVKALRDFLEQQLPSYMVPSAFVVLAELPLNPNGKLDRCALPAPDDTVQLEQAVSVAPRTEAEQLLAELWCDVLGLERVGVHDDFFALGGHSLKATQIISRVYDIFGVQLPLRSFVDGPTIAALAAAIEAALIEELSQLSEQEAMALL